jgi:hypothetical protein
MLFVILGIDRTVLQVECCVVDIISHRLLSQPLLFSEYLEWPWILGLSREICQKYVTSSSAWIQSKTWAHRVDLIKIIYCFVLEASRPSLVN